MTSAADPRRPQAAGARSHRIEVGRHAGRVAAVLAEASERPEILLRLVGAEVAARRLGLPEAAIDAFMAGRPALRRRFACRLRESLGLTRAEVAAALALPPEDEALRRAVAFFGVALRLAGEPRVLPRERRRALAETYGEPAVAFALPRRGALFARAEAIAELLSGAPGGEGDAALFVAALAARRRPAASACAVRLGLAPPQAGAPVTDAFGAPLDALPDLASEALDAVLGPAPAAAPSPSGADEAGESGPSLSVRRERGAA